MKTNALRGPRSKAIRRSVGADAKHLVNSRFAETDFSRDLADALSVSVTAGLNELTAVADEALAVTSSRPEVGTAEP